MLRDIPRDAVLKYLTTAILKMRSMIKCAEKDLQVLEELRYGVREIAAEDFLDLTKQVEGYVRVSTETSFSFLFNYVYPSVIPTDEVR